MKMNNKSKPQKDSEANRKIFDLDITEPLDVKKAIELLNGNKKLYISMLSKIEVHSLNIVLGKMATACN